MYEKSYVCHVKIMLFRSAMTLLSVCMVESQSIDLSDGVQNTLRTVPHKRHGSFLAWLLAVSPQSGTARIEARAVTVHACLDQCLHRLHARFGAGLAKLRERASLVSDVKHVKLAAFAGAILGG